MLPLKIDFWIMQLFSDQGVYDKHCKTFLKDISLFLFSIKFNRLIITIFEFKISLMPLHVQYKTDVWYTYM